MNILIIGGTAFIGYHIVQELAQAGHRITLFNRGKRETPLPAGVRRITGEKKDLALFKADFTALQLDAVLDMIPFSDADAALVVETFSGIAKRLVAVSSCDVYRAYGKLIGNESGSIETYPLTEDSPLRDQRYPYRGKAGYPERLNDYDKILYERLVMSAPALPATVLRLPMVYGQMDYQRRVSEYLRRMDDRRPSIVLDEKQAVWKTARSYVSDVAHAVCLALQNDRAAGRIYNVCEETAYTERAWVERIAAAAGWNGTVLIAPAGKLPVTEHFEHHLEISSARIREELGFEETVSSGAALTATVAWERANPSPAAMDYTEEDALIEKISAHE